MESRKRNFFNPQDPYFKRKIFNKNYNSVYNTNKVLSIISPKDHSAWMNQSIDQIKSTSKELMSAYCDKEKSFYNKKMQDTA